MTEFSLVSDLVSAVEVVAHFTTTSVRALASFVEVHDVEARHESTMHSASLSPIHSSQVVNSGDDC